MKAAFLLLFFIPVLSFAQQKGDSKIIATPSDTTRLFYKLITLLYTEGYTIKVDDSARGIIITDPKTIDAYYQPQVRLKLLVKENAVTISGDYDSNIDLGVGGTKVKSSFQPIEYRGMKGSILRNTFKEMDRIAKIIGAVSYSK